MQDLILRITKGKRLGSWLKWYSACPARQGLKFKPQYRGGWGRNEEQRRCKDLACSWIGKINIVTGYSTYQKVLTDSMKFSSKFQ
jgi:hypothetical protein